MTLRAGGVVGKYLITVNSLYFYDLKIWTHTSTNATSHSQDRNIRYWEVVATAVHYHPQCSNTQYFLWPIRQSSILHAVTKNSPHQSGKTPPGYVMQKNITKAERASPVSKAAART